MKYNHKNTKAKLITYLFLISVLFSSLSPLKVFGVDYKFYAANDILYYDPNACKTSSSSSGSGGSTATPEGSNVPAVMKFLVGKGFTLNQAAGIAGNWMQESTTIIDPTVIQSGGNADANYRPQDHPNDGFGIAQWSDNGRQQNMYDYAQETKRPINDLNFQLDWFWKELLTSYLGGAVELSRTTTIEEAVGTFQTSYEGAGQPEMGNRLTYANDAYNMVKDTLKDGDPAVLQKALNDAGAGNIDGGGSSSGSSSNCTSSDNGNSNGAVAGDIVKTALNFALTEPAENGQFDKYPVTQSYKDYMKSVGRNPDSTDDSSDCGKFVAAVMRASGVDPSYPASWVPSQYDYAVQNPDKYTVIRPAKESDLQPGDIMIADGGGSFYHTMIYTGESTYPAVDASYQDRNPSVRTSAGYMGIMNSDGIVIIRVKK